MPLRNIIQIDEDKCNGCGQCVLACAEGALALVDGKAKLIGDVLCDGIGACIGECPQGALTITQREAPDFNEAVVHEHLARQKEKPALPCGCPSSQAVELTPKAGPGERQASSLGHFPVKLRLVNPGAPFLKEKDLLILADCAAVAYANLHQDLLREKAVVMACPKFEDMDAAIAHLTEIFKTAKPKSLTVAYMEVPCCKGLVYATGKALEQAGIKAPVTILEIARDGAVKTTPPGPGAAQGCACGN
jgi:ferredoxin